MTPVLSSPAGVTLIGGGEVTAADLAQALALAPVVPDEFLPFRTRPNEGGTR